MDEIIEQMNKALRYMKCYEAGVATFKELLNDAIKTVKQSIADAEANGDAELVDTLKTQLKCYTYVKSLFEATVEK